MRKKSIALSIVIFLAISLIPGSSVFARITVPTPEYYSSGLFINEKTQECGVAQIEDRFFKYSYSPEFRLIETFDLSGPEKFEKICTAPGKSFSCEFSSGDDGVCKAKYKEWAGSDIGYDTCQLTHEKCKIISGNTIVGYRNYVSLKYSEIVFKTSSLPYVFLIFAIFILVIILPIFNILIRRKGYFSARIRNWILGISIFSWVLLLICWLLFRILFVY